MNKELKKLFEDAVTIEVFLKDYYGIDVYGKKIVHKEVSKLLPNIKHTSFDEILKDKKLISSGKVVLVRDNDGDSSGKTKGKVIPYVVSDCYMILDERERIIKELISAIKKIIDRDNKSFIILENLDYIDDDLLESVFRSSFIKDENILKFNNDGGILIKNMRDIYTIKGYRDSVECMERLKKGIIISILDDGSIYVLYDGKDYFLNDSLMLKNLLIKFYYPNGSIKNGMKEEKCQQHYDFESMSDYEVECVLKYAEREKNWKLYRYVKKFILNPRRRDEKKLNADYKYKKRQIEERESTMDSDYDVKIRKKVLR